MNRKQHGNVVLASKVNKARSLGGSLFKFGFASGMLTTLAFVHFTFGKGVMAFLDLLHGWLNFSLLPSLLPMPKGLHGPRDLWLHDWAASETYRHWAGAVFVVSALVSIFLLLKIQKNLGAKAVKGISVREGELKFVTPEQLKKEITSEVKSKKSDHEYTPHDLLISDSQIRVPDKVSGLSWSISGASGSGKTNVLNSMIVQTRAAKGKGFIVDPNGEFYKRHGKKTDVILSLFDHRQAKWDPWAEKMDYTQMANGLIELRENMNPEQKFWNGGARNIMSSFLRHSRSLEELWQLCNLSLDETRAFLKDRNDPNAKALGEGFASKVGEGRQAIATQDIGLFLKYMGHFPSERERVLERIEPTFSIRDWVMDDSDDRWVFVIAKDSDWAVSRPLIRLWTHIATYSLLERGEDPAVMRFWLMCDEVSTVGEVPAVPLLLDRGRKYRARLVLGFQTFAQIVENYGQTGAQKILNGLQNRIIFGVTDSDLADKYSAALSSQEIEIQSVSQTVSSDDRSNIAYQLTTRRVVSPGEILGLKERWAYLKLAGFNPTKIYFSYEDHPVVNRSRLEDLRPDQFYLETIPVKHYRSSRDQERNDFLDKFKTAVDRILQTYHMNHPDRKDMLGADMNTCLILLGEAASIKEKIDGEIYELTLTGGSSRFLTAIRGASRLVLATGFSGNLGESVEAQSDLSAPEPDILIGDLSGGD